MDTKGSIKHPLLRAEKIRKRNEATHAFAQPDGAPLPEPDWFTWDADEENHLLFDWPEDNESLERERGNTD
jgi:hypothetical protein